MAETESPPAAPVLSYPMLEGMTYPRLEAAKLVRRIRDEGELLGLPQAARDVVRVLGSTSATRGCSAKVAAALPDLRLVVSQGAGQDKMDLTALAARGVRVRSIGEALTEDVADLAIALAQMCSAGSYRRTPSRGRCTGGRPLRSRPEPGRRHDGNRGAQRPDRPGHRAAGPGLRDDDRWPSPSFERCAGRRAFRRYARPGGGQ